MKKKAADWAVFSFLKAAQIWSTRPMRYSPVQADQKKPNLATLSETCTADSWNNDHYLFLSVTVHVIKISDENWFSAILNCCRLLYASFLSLDICMCFFYLQGPRMFAFLVFLFKKFYFLQVIMEDAVYFPQIWYVFLRGSSFVWELLFEKSSHRKLDQTFQIRDPDLQTFDCCKSTIDFCWIEVTHFN